MRPGAMNLYSSSSSFGPIVRSPVKNSRTLPTVRSVLSLTAFPTFSSSAYPPDKASDLPARGRVAELQRSVGGGAVACKGIMTDPFSAEI